MAYCILNPEDFLTNGVLMEDPFLERAASYDWETFRGKSVLVRGCQSTVIPPWVYMYFTGKLAGIAKSVRFGNEHSNIVVYRATETVEKM